MNRWSAFLAATVLCMPGVAVKSQTSVANAVPRDAQAIAAMVNAISTMGPSPSDSVATGAVKLTVGGKSEAGTVTIRTRGLTETSETIQTPSGTQVFVYADGDGSENLNNGPKVRSLELAVSSQSAMFPLPLLANSYADTGTAIQFVGSETLSAIAVYHIRSWKDYSSIPYMRHLTKFSQREIWINQKTWLPLKISYDRRTANGAEAAIHVDVVFSDYNNVNGFMYPFQITKSLNGSVWATITIERVNFNTGLTAADFPVN
jgi:hypothetical protein